MQFLDSHPHPSLKTKLSEPALKKPDWNKDDYYKGYTHWVNVGGQSMEIKQAYAEAAARVLVRYNIPAHSMSRMD